ncbi:hypothetical protein FOA52_015376, partial [Chlamydomonas sp. UWO 241]
VKHGVNVFAAHIHNCSSTCNGPVYVTVFDLTDATGATPYVTGTFTVSIMVNLAVYPELLDLVMSGNAYVNVHTKAYPAGEIRAQLLDTTHTITSVASSIPELTYFVAAITAAPELLGPASSATTAATVFAPSNAAFEAAITTMGMSIEELLNNTMLLTELLAYHVHANDVYLAADVPAAPGINITTLLYDTTLRVEATNGTVMVNDAKVVVADISVNNYTSVIHIIDAVLTPPMTPPTIVSVASDIRELTYFVAAVTAAPELLAAASNSSTQATVFAPSNTAFEAALVAIGMSIDELLNDTALLAAVLSYHVHANDVYLAVDVPAAPGINITTLLADNATLQVQATNGTVTVNDAKVIRANISVSNYTAVIHVIDTVLLPPIM